MHALGEMDPRNCIPLADIVALLLPSKAGVSSYHFKKTLADFAHTCTLHIKNQISESMFLEHRRAIQILALHSRDVEEIATEFMENENFACEKTTRHLPINTGRENRHELIEEFSLLMKELGSIPIMLRYWMHTELVDMVLEFAFPSFRFIYKL